MRTVLVPGSGCAVRMRGLPKFLLPSGVEDFSLFELHVTQVIDYADEVLIAINPIFINIVENANLNLLGARIVPLETKTMTETVLKLTSISLGSRFTVIMPDTVFESNESYTFDSLTSVLDLSL